MKYIIYIAALFLLFTFPSSASAATKYWYNAGADANWATLSGNWWDDATHLVQSVAIPSASDDVITLGSTGPILTIDGAFINPLSIDASVTGLTVTSGSLQKNMTGNATFNNTARNMATITGDAIFNNSSQNFGVPAVVTGNATFNDSSRNTSGIVNGNAIFNGTSRTSGIIGGNATFYDFAYNSGTTVSGDGIFEYSVNGIITLSDSMYWGGTYGGEVKGLDDVVVTHYIFNEFSGNDDAFVGTAEFNDESYAYGAITGDVVFNDSAINYSVITGNVIFYDSSQNNSGTVNGNATFNGLSVNSGTVNDTIDPEITDIATTTTVSTATITWTTDEHASSTVNYGLTNSYGTASSSDTLISSHSVTLEGLTSCTLYYYQVVSTDAYLNASTSTEALFTTECEPEVVEETPKRRHPSSGSSPRSTLVQSTINQSVESLLAIINSLIEQITVLSKAQGIPFTAPIINANENASFLRDLEIGVSGSDVKALQAFLNSNGFPVSTTGEGSLNNETIFFGPATKTALIKFQIANGITPAEGYFGPKTRGYIK